MGEIASNLIKVRERIEAACGRAGRSPDEVTLVAVSKTHPASAVMEAMAAGQSAFGENKVQELTKKAGACQGPISWHMIGHLQLNKVKYLPGLVTLIHSVDSIRLVDEIERRFSERGEVAAILIEVNVAGEETKYGLSPSEVPDFVREAGGRTHICIRGLMTIAPYAELAETNRPYFRRLRELMDEINAAHIPAVRMDTLSMGMSSDYEVAIEEGATIVRVGTAIFGARDYGA